MLGLKPIYDTQHSLTMTLAKEQRIQKQLQQAKAEIGNQKIYPSLSADNALKQVATLIGVRYNATIGSEGINVRITKQNFDRLQRGLYTLKQRHGIVVTNATITRVASGLVDATLLFTHP